MTQWMYLIVSLVGGGILLGLGLTKVRTKSPTAGYLFAATGTIVPLSACCVSALSYADEAFPDPATVFTLTTVLSTFADLVAVVLMAVAFVVLGKARARG